MADVRLTKDDRGRQKHCMEKKQSWNKTSDDFVLITGGCRMESKDEKQGLQRF